MGRWYGPDEDWPTHPRSHWRRTLKVARDADWHLRKYDGHAFGKIACRAKPDAYEAADVCVVNVDSTAEGAETIALEAQQRIRLCPHKTETPVDSQADSPVVKAQQKLKDAGRFLDGAERLIAHANAWREAQDALDRAEAFDQAEDRIADAELLLEYALAEEQSAAGAAREAENILRELNVPQESTAEDLIDHAQATTDAVGSISELQQTIEGLRARIADLRRQVARLQ